MTKNKYLSNNVWFDLDTIDKPNLLLTMAKIYNENKNNKNKNNKKNGKKDYYKLINNEDISFTHEENKLLKYIEKIY